MDWIGTKKVADAYLLFALPVDEKGRLVPIHPASTE